MSAGIAHRGPDGDGLWTSPSGRACLAHRRLSIIDLATGQQPMVEESGTFAITFNGEIYNYVELREALVARGVLFRTRSDTEVLLRLLQLEWRECLPRLRGMFAFAAWDDSRGELLLARDSIGKKPLYYVIEDDCLYFCSCLFAIRETSRREWDITPESVDVFLDLGYIPAPQTIYRSVGKLPAATMGALDGNRLFLQRFWDAAEERYTFEGSYDQALEKLQELLSTAVRIRLRSDVPLGIFLSGGIDSSLVAVLAAKIAKTPIETFSIGFDESDFDESGYAAALAQHIGVRHRFSRVRPNVLSLMSPLARHFGEPFADSSALATWTLAQQARRYVKVALGGDGGDEGFAGYDWYRTAARLSGFSRAIPSGMAAAAHGWMPAASRGQRDTVGRLKRGLDVLAMAGPAERFAVLRTHFDGAEADRLQGRPSRSHGASLARPGTAVLQAAYDRADGSALRRMRYTDVATYLSDDLMTKVDVTSMAHALEVRAPLLDQDVLQFALSLPDRYLIDKRGGKRILRDLLARHVPRHLFERRKQGFSVPLRHWFANELRPAIQRLSRSEHLHALGAIDLDAVGCLLNEHAAGRRDHSQRLFSLLTLDAWLKCESDQMRLGEVEPEPVSELLPEAGS